MNPLSGAAPARVTWRACARAMHTVCLVLLLVAALSRPTRAHEGHDHGDKASPAGAAAASPRVSATSEHYQLVAIVEGEVLVLYLDRADDNAPVTSAAMEVSLEDRSYRAELQKGGVYEVIAPILRQPGTHAMVVAITDGDRSDLLAAALAIPRDADGRDEAIARWPLGRMVAIALCGVLVLLLAAMALRRARATLLVMLAAGTLFIAETARAHDGKEHGPDLSAATGNTPARRADGTIFLPKPAQRLLEVRTKIAATSTARRTVRLTGRVVANPNFSGVVQSTIAGRYQAPVGGVPAIAARVKAGDLLGSVSPSFTSVDSSDMAQTLGDLDQKISIARTKLARQEQLLRTNVVASAIVDEARLELEGLQKRRVELLAARTRVEELRAPVEGVIAAARVVSGQVISQADRIFEIVDPGKLLVEALVFDEIASESVTAATGIGRGGATSRLHFLGRSRALQQQYSLMQFEVLETSAALDVGAPVTVLVEIGASVEGLFIPKAALAQAANGQVVVFEHKEPEVFVPRAVRIEPFDNDTVRVVGGLAPGAKIVVRNAALVAQVR